MSHHHKDRVHGQIAPYRPPGLFGDCVIALLFGFVALFLYVTYRAINDMPASTTREEYALMGYGHAPK